VGNASLGGMGGEGGPEAAQKVESSGDALVQAHDSLQQGSRSKEE